VSELVIPVSRPISYPSIPKILRCHVRRWNLTGRIDRATALEALRRSQYKFPGRQKIIVSKNWGFTPLRREEYMEKKQGGKVLVDGAYVQFLSNHGKLADNIRRFPAAFQEA
jgi:hypothetical protein